ncbi:MAG: phosphate starvation-inducible protein PhoH [Methylobacterium sp.]|nr:MAG: phosphate starvation-inducible protein PhoH [Methylobacterium sp.]
MEAALDGVEESLTLDDNRAAVLLVGNYDQNIAHLERRLNVLAHVNGNQIRLRGTRDAVNHARRVIENLYAAVRKGRTVGVGDVDGAIEETAMQRALFPVKSEDAGAVARESTQGFGHVATRKRGPVKARNSAQDAYLRVLARHELTFAEGPAGTGKTWLAVGHAVQLLEAGHVERLILSRPAVEAGEKIGFLPGDMREKVDPYLRPIYDALYDFMEGRLVERALQTGVIEIAPLAFMRGRTLANALILLDEAQNASSMQMKMFLTRLGEGSRMIITGDPTQIDLPPGQTSGFAEAIALLKDVEGIGHVKFGHQHVVRHDLVRRIVQAYEERGPDPTPPSRRG